MPEQDESTGPLVRHAEDAAASEEAEIGPASYGESDRPRRPEE